MSGWGWSDWLLFLGGFSFGAMVMFGVIMACAQMEKQIRRMEAEAKERGYQDGYKEGAVKAERENRK